MATLMAIQKHVTDDARIRELSAEVERLKTKLGELHNSDVHQLKRAHRTLTEHIQALRKEAEALWPLMREVEQEVITPDFVAKEMSAAAIITANTVALHKVLDMTGLKGKQRKKLKLLVAGLAVVGFSWRLVARVVKRTVEVVRTSGSTRRRLLHEWRTVLDRIDIMTALVEWQPEDSGKAQLLGGAGGAGGGVQLGLPAGEQQAGTSAYLGLPEVPQHPVLPVKGGQAPGQGQGAPMPPYGWAVQQQEDLAPVDEPSAPAWPG